jgi:hypothetical protein
VLSKSYISLSARGFFFSLAVRGRAFRLQRVPCPPPQGVLRVRPRRRLPSQHHPRRRRRLVQGPLPQRSVRLPGLRHLPRGRRPPGRVPVRAVQVLGARLRLRRLAALAPRPPRRRTALVARGHDTLRRQQDLQPAGDAAAPPARRGGRDRVPRVLVRDGGVPLRRLGGLRQGERRRRGGAEVQVLDDCAWPSGGRFGSDDGSAELLGAERGHGGGGGGPGYAEQEPARVVHGDAPRR